MSICASTRAYGILALVVTLFVANIMTDLPMTFDSSAWYAGAGYGGLFIVAALTAAAFYTSRGSRRFSKIRRQG